MTNTTGEREHKRVLIVEDDPRVRRGLELLLMRYGFEVLAVTSVATALKRLDENGICCMLLDLVLPDGRGTTVLEHIRSRGMDVRVAVTTGTEDLALLEAVDRLRPDAFYRKPVELGQIVKWLATC